MSIEDTLTERGNRYGDFSDHARLAQSLQNAMRDFVPNGQKTPPWDLLSAVHKQALTVIADKIARILNGDPLYIDSFRDIIGYTQLVINAIEKTDGATDVRLISLERRAGQWCDEKSSWAHVPVLDPHDIPSL